MQRGKNGTQKKKFPIWKIPISLLTAQSLTFLQDNAPAHRAGDTMEFLSRNTPDFISPLLWPSNSPELNPVDYEVGRAPATRLL